MMFSPRIAISPISPARASVALEVDELHLAARDGAADRAGLGRLVGHVERGDGRGLGQAVALEDLAAELLLEGPHDLCRHGRAAGRARAQAVGVGLPSAFGWWSIAAYIVGTPWKIVTRSRRSTSMALAGSNRGISVSVAPLDRGVEPARQAEDVEQRQAAHHDVVLADLHDVAGRAARR